MCSCCHADDRAYSNILGTSELNRRLATLCRCSESNVDVGSRMVVMYRNPVEHHEPTCSSLRCDLYRRHIPGWSVFKFWSMNHALEVCGTTSHISLNCSHASASGESCRKRWHMKLSRVVPVFGKVTIYTSWSLCSIDTSVARHSSGLLLIGAGGARPSIACTPLDAHFFIVPPDDPCISTMPSLYIIYVNANHYGGCIIQSMYSIYYPRVWAQE